jgi:hypothetical protein
LSKQKPASKRQNYQVYTVEVCPTCNFKAKRPFEIGDFVFKVAGECSHCKKDKTRIEMIYAESTKRSK